MYTPVQSLIAVVPVAVLAAMVASGCRTSGEVSSDSNRSAAAAQALAADEHGRVDVSTTGTTGIRGRWFASADTEDCRKKGKHPSAVCSMLLVPDPPASVFRPTPDLGMCAVGIAAKAVAGPDGNPDWKNVWGAHIGLALNDNAPYDARTHGVTGFSFHIDTEPPPNAGIRVQFPTPTTDQDPALWGGAAAETSPVHAGHNEVRWADVGGPPFVAHPPPFDPSRILSIIFRVPSSPSGPKSFSFCINQLTALKN